MIYVVSCALGVILSLSAAFGQSRLVRNLRQGKPQVLVVYGTSLSAGEGGKVWVDTIADQLNKRYGNRLSCYNTGKSAMWSTWGVQHLEDSVVSRKPDAVLIEFAINDAFIHYHTSPQLAQLNLEYMIQRLMLDNPDCEIILQIMNPPIGQHAADRPGLADYNAIYRKIAKKYKLLLIDHEAYWQDILLAGTDAFLIQVPDGIHPNAESAQSLIAPHILRALENTNP
ncbi:SGNH/GDSL hydrolase family protein [Parapedobacter sp. DT-150]|uniref:SGNH/GDSL hydrolase family protein n=1 Tax=Parapedobacter sp. DT-150 TaxID=3396162 RepID=UPI003F1CE953